MFLKVYGKGEKSELTITERFLGYLKIHSPISPTKTTPQIR